MSSDGINWIVNTALEVNGARPTFNGSNIPAFGDGNWVAWKPIAPSVIPYTSPDSSSWSARPRIPTTKLSTGGFSVGTPGNVHLVLPAQELSFSNGRFFGFISTMGQGSAKNVELFHSVDGANWVKGVVSGLVYVDQWAGATARTDLCEVRGIANSPTMSIAVGRGIFGNLANSPTITDKCIRSSNQVNWVGTTLPFKALWNGIAYGGGRFVAVCDGLNAATTINGTNWAIVRMPSTLNWTSIAYGNGKWIAVGGPSSVAAISADGLTWNTINLPSSATWTSVAYGNGKFIITNSSGGSIYSTGY
jgi:hypothetical protein